MVRRASRGDVTAFSQLVEAHSGLVCGVALRILGPNDAEDACQEAWVLAWRNMKKFEGDSAFSTWVYRIAVNACLSWRHREARHDRRRADHEVPYPAGPLGGDADPEAGTLSAERREEIVAALGRVRGDHRNALVLWHMDGLPYSEIAERLAVPVGTAKGWVSRGRDAMLVVLSEGIGPHEGKEASA